MRQHKHIRFMAATVLTALMLSACSSATTTTGSTTAAPAADSGATTAAAGTGALDTSKPVELVLYVVSDRPANQDEIDENFNKIATEALNCTLKTNWIGWAEYANKYPLLFSSGEKFDLAYSATWLNLASLAQKGAFKSLDELWPTYAPKNFARQSETALKQATIDGHYYAIPTLLATYSAYGPIYRTDFLEGTSWDGKMETLEDLEEYLDLAKANTTMQPLDVYQSGSEMDDLYMYNQGMFAIKGSTNDFLWIDPAQDSPKLFTYYEYEKTPDFLTMMARWNEKEFFTKSALSDTASTKLRDGLAAARVHNIDTYSGEYIQHPEYMLKYANLVKDVSYLSFTQDALVVSNTSENPERALALYDLITNDEPTYRAFYYGIEGVSYEIENNQVKQLSPDLYAFSSLWAARTSEFNLPTVGSPEDLQTQRSGFDAVIKEGVGAQKYRSFILDTSSIETEYAACQNVHQQYWWPLELGYTDAVAGLAEYKEKMEAAGIETVRVAVQTQLDAYLASLAE